MGPTVLSEVTGNFSRWELIEIIDRVPKVIKVPVESVTVTIRDVGDTFGVYCTELCVPGTFVFFFFDIKSLMEDVSGGIVGYQVVYIYIVP